MSGAAHSPLSVSGTNSRYFADHLGNAVVLAGSHTWANFQEVGESDPPPSFDYNAYLDYIKTRGHNFFRLWRWEQTSGITSAANFHVADNAYARSRFGTTLDDSGHPFDLDAFDNAYFERMRSRCVRAWAKGVYVSIMLFQGFSLNKTEGGSGLSDAWAGHPFNAANNVNEIDGDDGGNADGLPYMRLAVSAVTTKQEEYIDQVLATVGDLPNILFEICNEAEGGGDEVAWTNHLIDYIHTAEAGARYQHPVGYTVNYPNGDNADLRASNAEWISPNDDGASDLYKTDPPANDGTKVILADTDHLWGLGGDSDWAWKTFLRGISPVLMDPYDSGQDGSAVGTIDPDYETLRLNLGYIVSYAARLDLIASTIQNGGGSPCSTGYCIYKAGDAYMCYQPSTADFTLALGSEAGTWQVEKKNPNTGATDTEQSVSGGATRSITRPSGWTNWAAYIYKT